MQAIRTRYHGPTNTRGSRIIAKCEGGSVTMPYNHALNLDGNHAAAARLLLQRMGWANQYAGGCFEHDYYWSPIVDGGAINDPSETTLITSDCESEAA
jgi:hypothetical protein